MKKVFVAFVIAASLFCGNLLAEDKVQVKGPENIPGRVDRVRPTTRIAKGIFGKVNKIDGANIVLAGRDGAEKTVLTDGTTKFTAQGKDIVLADIKVGDMVRVVGDEGKAAKEVMVIPARQPRIGGEGKVQPKAL
jgi:hypothetical protein